MRRMAPVLAVAGMVLSGLGSTVPVSGAAAGAPIDPEVLSLRAEAWRAWFAGDEASLGKMLPPEFIGLDMGPGPFSTRAATLEASRAFRAGGGRLVEIDFPETQAQRYGDVVVLYGRYRIVIESQGKQQTIGGRLTEVFVRKDGRWLHPGWHLDQTAP
jgi:hypothetical protein